MTDKAQSHSGSVIVQGCRWIVALSKENAMFNAFQMFNAVYIHVYVTICGYVNTHSMFSLQSNSLLAY